MLKPSTELLLTLPLVAATVALFWVVPDSPLRHLDHPTYWAVLAYGCLLILLAAIRQRRPLDTRSRDEHIVLAVFLAGMPLVYLASAFRSGAAPAWWMVELSGLVLYAGLARCALTRTWVLPVGLLAHGLWDLAHYQRTPFVPSWYAVACAVVDFGLSVYAIRLVALTSRHADGPETMASAGHQAHDVG